MNLLKIIGYLTETIISKEIVCRTNSLWCQDRLRHQSPVAILLLNSISSKWDHHLPFNPLPNLKTQTVLMSKRQHG